MMYRFDLYISICSKRAKVHYAHIKVQLFPKIRIVKNGNISQCDARRKYFASREVFFKLKHRVFQRIS